MVGFAVAGSSRDEDMSGGDVGEIQAIYVRPSWWSHGVGRALIEAATRWVVGAGLRQATLWIPDRNQRARRFYERNGSRTDGATKTATIGGTEINEVRYRQVL